MVGSQDCKGEEINWLSVNNDKGTAHAKAKALVWAALIGQNLPKISII